MRKRILCCAALLCLAFDGAATEIVLKSMSVALSHPSGITADINNLYVSDSANNRILKIELATGNVITLAGSFEVP